MPRLLRVALLMTFTREPLSTMHPVISVPCTSTLIAVFWWTMVVGPLVDSVIEVLRNCVLRHMQPAFHCLSKIWHQIEEFAHGENNREIRKCLAYWVDFWWGVLCDCCRCAILAHPFDICLIGLCNPGFRRFVYLVLVLPLGHLGMTVGSYVLYLHCDCVDRQEFSLLLIWILWCVWPWLLAIEAV